jgi:hypothetical protein
MSQNNEAFFRAIGLEKSRGAGCGRVGAVCVVSVGGRFFLVFDSNRLVFIDLFWVVGVVEK